MAGAAACGWHFHLGLVAIWRRSVKTLFIALYGYGRILIYLALTILLIYVVTKFCLMPIWAAQSVGEGLKILE